MIILRLVTILLACALSSNAFSFWFTSTPTQCGNLTIEWSAGSQAPLTLLLVPTGHLNPETRTIIERDIPSGNSVSLVLNYPSQSQFIAILDDATGIGTGGTSAVTTVSASSDSSCLSTTPSSPKFFLFLPSDISQCDSVDISWQSNAEDPVDILALIPGGQSFEIANVTDKSTSIDWRADVRSGTDILFVAGDKDGLGSGGSSDVIQIDDGDDVCLNDSSPSSTAGPAAGGVSTTSPGGQPSTQTVGESTTAGTSTTIQEGQTGTQSSVVYSGSGSSAQTVGGGSSVSQSSSQIVGGTGTSDTEPGGGISTAVVGTSSLTDSSNDGSNNTNNPTGSNSGFSGGSSNGATSSGGSGFPGSSGGTVTGSEDVSTKKRHSNLGLILGLVLGILAFFGFLVGGYILYRRQRGASAYHNLEASSSQAPWLSSVARGALLRGGVDISNDTLPSMYQAEPFILPSEQQPFFPQAPPPVQQERPNLGTRASSSRSVQSLLGEVPYARDALGGGLVGMHSSSQKENVGRRGMLPSRTPSGRELHPRGMPPPISTDPPTRVTRDSQDFSPDSEEMSPNPLDEAFVEIPPTYASVRRASRSNDRESWQQLGGARLTRSNASRHSRGLTRSGIGTQGSLEHHKAA